jgi:predicted porin
MRQFISRSAILAMLGVAGIAHAQPAPAPADPPGPTEPAASVDPVPPVAPTPTGPTGPAPIPPAVVPMPEPAQAPRDPALAALGVSTDGAGSRRFVIYRNQEVGAWLKPVIAIAGAVAVYFPQNKGNPELDHRTTTLAISRFGFEGAVNKYVELGLQFQRDLGFSIAGGGPVGTGVWEGTASLQARESYVRLKRWGVELSAGIVSDPASVDYVPSQMFDLFGMDPYIRDPLLFSGFNMSQGVMLRVHDPYLYKLGMPGKLTLGMHFTSGNPLITSLSFGFGGNVSSNGTLFTSPLRALSNGFPGSNIEVQTYSPSLTYEADITDKIGVDLRAGLQLYSVDIDVQSAEDVHLSGSNARLSARVRLPYLNLMGSYARRTNDQLPIPDLTMLADDKYKASVWSLGGEGTYDRFGLGVLFADVQQDFSGTVANTARYFNAAASYALDPTYLSVGLRYASLWNKPRGTAATPTDANTLLLTLRLTI